MINFEVKGAIFDVDDTLLDNKPGIPGQGLHERSRLAAVHAVGAEHDIEALKALTARQNLDAFLNAPVHTLEAAVWNILLMTGIADSDVINPDHPLLKQIVDLKNHLHEDILMQFGEEVPNATRFVNSLNQSLPDGRLAIASTAVRRDIDLFLGKTGLTVLFPEERIKSKESITHPKPHPEVFDAAFSSLGIPESDRRSVCAFEDDPRGIMSAKAAGLFVCAITTRYPAGELARLEVAPDLIADTYVEFAHHFGLSLPVSA